MFEHFNNLSKHVFKHEEIDFLCDCYHSGIYSLIGGINLHGERRLTISGVCDRYRLTPRFKEVVSNLQEKDEK